MTYDPDDPRLTAYALGELEGEERSAVESLLAEHPDALASVEQVRALAQILTSGLHAEPSPGLSDAQHLAIAESLDHKRPAVVPFLPRWGRLALAASLLIGLGTSLFLWYARPAGQVEPDELLAFRDASPAEITAAAPASENEVTSVSPAPKRLLGREAGSSLHNYDAVSGRAVAGGERLIEGVSRDHAVGSSPLNLGLPSDSPATGPQPIQPGLKTPAQAASRGYGVAPAPVPSGLAVDPETFFAGKAGMSGGMRSGYVPMPRKSADEFVEPGPGGSVEAERLNEQLSIAQELRNNYKGTEFVARGQEPGRGATVDPPTESYPGRPEPPSTPKADDSVKPEAEPLAAALDLDSIANQPQALGRERFTPIIENPFEAVTPGDTFSTFAIDVDTAGYANVRRYLTQNVWPPADAVRIEEMVNYFDYGYAPPAADDPVPFAVHTEVVRCPWQPDHQLLRVGLKGRAIDFANRKPSNLVFLVDVSGSMDEPDKLPLVKAGLRMLVEQLGENDKIALVVYAGNAGLLMPSTHGHHKAEILGAIDRLAPGGSTNGADGLALAYDMAAQNFIQGGVNRVILATDGDFNTGMTGPDKVAGFAAERARSGVFLSVLGVGQGNLQDEMMEKIANQANGTYHYLDTLMEAHRVLVEQVGGTLVTIAKDVKIQVDFNPAKVREYRLIGYENRHLEDADFTNDAKDAGEIGSGHTVTALYELAPVVEGAPAAPSPVADASRYVKPAEVDPTQAKLNELLTVRLRYKAPDGQESQPTEHHVPDDVKDLGHASTDTKFAAAVAEFGMLLRGSRFAGQSSLSAARELAAANLGPDPRGRRAELVGLIEKAQSIRPPTGGPDSQPLAAPSEQ